MKPPANPVTPEDADKFQAHMEHWQAKLNLLDWRIVRSPTRAKSSMAQVQKCQVQDRLASYRIGLDFGAEPVSDCVMESTAVHELLHILLAELIELAQGDGTTDAQLVAAEHRVINTLERLLVPRP